MASPFASSGPDRTVAAAIFRAVTAFVGGYAAAGLWAALIVRFLPIARAEAVGWGLVLSFGLYAGLLLFAYTRTRLLRVMAVIWGSAAMLALLFLLVGPRP